MNDKVFRVLVINPGSTSTKLAVFDNKDTVAEYEIHHSNEELKAFDGVIDQKDFRSKLVFGFLKKHDILLDSLDAVIGRGGLLKPIAGSIAHGVNEQMLDALSNCRYGEHPSNLGALISHDIAKEKGIPAFIIDPVVVDEMFNLARYSGHPEIPRLSIWHALNQKAAARKYALEKGKRYEEVNVIVAHLGGGISVGAHRRGKTVDVNNALNGDGPFTPERSGGLPANQLVELCFSGKYEKGEIQKMIKGKGGVMAYLGTNDLRKVEKWVEQGKEKPTEVLQAMTYQTCKEICSLIPAFQGDVIDSIIITGGAARSPQIVAWVKEWLSQVSIEVSIYPGEIEMEALRDGALRILRGEETELKYS